MTSQRGRRVVEGDQYGAFIRRAIAAYARRVVAGDIEALLGLVRLSDELDDAIRAAAIGLHTFGYSWTEIASRLGITRQAAHLRWAYPPAPTSVAPSDSPVCPWGQVPLFDLHLGGQ